ncbi:MAG: EamA family transporter RarD [Thermicanus sp.]|nr:EamA family transporter RarD [Thermicanus sp.]
MEEKEKEYRRNHLIGVVYAVSAFALWGILPVYWKALSQVAPLEILAHRFIWSFVFVVILLFFHKRIGGIFQVFAARKKRLALIASAVLITTNWGVYIWAVNANHLIDASLGYYINPLVSIALGMLFLKERLNLLQMIALGLATLGVLLIGIEFGQIPWIALILAFSFGFYCLVKKMTHLDAEIGLAAETLVVLPFAFVYLIFNEQLHGWPILELPLPTLLLLLGAGVVTATPLLWFAQAANRVRLSTVGFIQYLTPTINLLLGVFLFREPFTQAHFFSFTLIWLALLLYSFSGLPLFKRRIPGKVRSEESFNSTR